LSGRKLKDGREGYGLVEHRQNGQDFRAKYLYLTPKGIETVSRIAGSVVSK
jgi:DNA-binding MarR family transcriptional regulator